MPESRSINTGGGWYTENGTVHHLQAGTIHYSHGDQVNTGGGGYAGRDLRVDLTRVFADARHRVAALTDEDLGTDVLHASLDRIEAEVGRGDAGDGTVVAQALRTLGGLVPDIAAIVAAGLTDPAAGVTLAVRTAAGRVAGWLDERRAAGQRQEVGR